MLVAKEQFACVLKGWFISKTIIYLQVMLYSDGTWKIAINKKYYHDKVNSRLWRKIRKKCKSCIQDSQKRVLRYVFNVNKSEIKNYRIDKMEVPYSICFKNIESYNLFKE